MESALYGIFTLVGFVSEISLVRCAHSFDFRYFTNSCQNPVRTRFPWSNLYLLYTYWDLHTEKLQSKFSFANRCKPIKCRVSLFPHVRKAIRPIRSRVSYFLTCEPYGKLTLSFTAGWRGFVHCTSHRFTNLKRANSFYSHFFHR